MNFIQHVLLLLAMCASLGIAQDQTQTKRTTRKTKEPIDTFLEVRKNRTIKDADIIIKMTKEFLKDMQLRMTVIGRVETRYDKSADFSTGLVISDILKKFKHMCDMYRNFATVRRYVLGHELDKSMVPNPDVVIIYQFMLSDYNEIVLLLEVFKIEQRSWKQGEDSEFSRNLINKQMEKLGNLPAHANLENYATVDDSKLGDQLDKEKKEKDAIEKKKDAEKLRMGGSGEGRRVESKWKAKEDRDSATKWSGALDGVGFDNR